MTIVRPASSSARVDGEALAGTDTDTAGAELGGSPGEGGCGEAEQAANTPATLATASSALQRLTAFPSPDPASLSLLKRRLPDESSATQLKR